MTVRDQTLSLWKEECQSVTEKEEEEKKSGFVFRKC